MARCLVVAPGATVVSIAPSARSHDSNLTAIVRHLETAEERLAALLPWTPHVEPHLEEIREIRAQMTTLAERADLATSPS